MTTFSAHLKIKPVMVEQINENVFRIHRTDLRNNSEKVFDKIHQQLNCHHSCLIVTSRHNAYVNGSGKLIEGIENDYRSHYLVVVNRNECRNVMYKNHQFDVITDRYRRIISVSESEYQIELMTSPKICNEVLKEYSALYNVQVDLNSGLCQELHT